MSRAGSNSNKTSDFDFADIRQEDIDDDLNLMVIESIVLQHNKMNKIKTHGLLFL
jgi:hypothetical protein